ncbi:carbonic anhydrase [Ranunculus cassubicifolius]
MSPSYVSCSFGNAQSPVQIMENDVVFDGNLDPLSIGYNDVSATLINNGFNCELCFGNDVGGAIIDGKNYTLKQMHWHSPSEHAIEGIRYAAELHLVHVSIDGSISVVAILYKNGALDPLLSQVKDGFNELAKQASAGQDRARAPIKLVRIKDIIMQSDRNRYFRYVGSLTTPPCTEKVIWNILKEVREISVEQVAALKTPLDESCKNNSRPTQPLNGRHIGLSAAAASLI